MDARTIRRVTMAALLGLLTSSRVPGQDAVPHPAIAEETVLPHHLRGVGTPDLPDEADWVIRIHASGGFAGVAQTATLGSTGAFRCAGFPEPCDPAGQAHLDALTRQIASTSPALWSGSVAEGYDLLTRMVVLVVRAPDGGSETHTAWWNLVPAGPSLDAPGIFQGVLDALGRPDSPRASR